MVLDCVLQLLQEGQIRGLPRAQTLFVLGGMTESDGSIGGGVESTGDLGAPWWEAQTREKGTNHRDLLQTASRPS